MSFDYDALVVGCGITGSVIARHIAEQGKKVWIIDRREHIGGNMYDYIDGHGILVHKYGPHTFHTNDKELMDYMRRFEEWKPYRLSCGAVIDGKYTPTPFNFSTIDTFFSDEYATLLKDKIKGLYNDREVVTVVEVLNCPDEDVRGYADFLFKKDYAPYTAKQWGVAPEEIDKSVLERVPLRMSYKAGYFEDEYQFMPEHSYNCFFTKLLDHSNIHVELGIDALDHIKIKGSELLFDGEVMRKTIIYTGAIDELLGNRFGKLPYRSLRFEWKYEDVDSKQPDPVVAYPQEPAFTRITEYKKLPVQNVKGTTYAVEYPLQYHESQRMEPYYPVITEQSLTLYKQYEAVAKTIPNLFCCGRLGDYKYYNMDQALRRALEICKNF